MHLGVSEFVERASRDACLLSNLVGEKKIKKVQPNYNRETETAEKEALLLWAPSDTPTPTREVPKSFTI